MILQKFLNSIQFNGLFPVITISLFPFSQIGYLHESLPPQMGYLTKENTFGRVFQYRFSCHSLDFAHSDIHL